MSSTLRRRLIAPAAALGWVQSGRPSGGFVHLLLATHELILAEGIPAEDEGLAYMNRLLRAAGFHVIDASKEI